jgi:hypothetical protein
METLKYNENRMLQQAHTVSHIHAKTPSNHRHEFHRKRHDGLRSPRHGSPSTAVRLASPQSTHHSP